MSAAYGHRSHILSYFTEESGQDFRAQLEELSLPRGAAVFHEGDASDGVYYIRTGKVKLGRARSTGDGAPGDRESLLRLLGPGSIFGELSAFDGGVRSSTAATVTAVTLYRMPQDDLHDLLRRHPDLATEMLAQLAHRLRWADLVLAGLSLNDVTGRVAATLLFLADTLGEETPDGIVVAHDLTQAELAAMVGATRETVNRTLTDLTTRGLIVRGTRKVTIVDIDRLRQRIL